MAGVTLLDEKMCNKKQDGILEDAFRLEIFSLESYSLSLSVEDQIHIQN